MGPLDMAAGMSEMELTDDTCGWPPATGADDPSAPAGAGAYDYYILGRILRPP